MNKEVSNKLELKGYVWTDGWLVGRTFWLWPHAVNFNDNDDNDEAWCFMQAIVSFSRPLFSSTLSKLVHSRSGNDLLRLKYVVDNNFRNSVVLSWSSFFFRWFGDNDLLWRLYFLSCAFVQLYIWKGVKM